MPEVGPGRLAGDRACAVRSITSSANRPQRRFRNGGRVWGSPIAAYWLASHREDGNEPGAEMRPLFSFVNIKLWPEVIGKAL